MKQKSFLEIQTQKTLIYVSINIDFNHKKPIHNIQKQVVYYSESIVPWETSWYALQFLTVFMKLHIVSFSMAVIRRKFYEASFLELSSLCHGTQVKILR